MKRYDVITFGECLIRLSTEKHERLEQAHVLAIHHGGTEANTAAALARLGLRTAWVSRLTDNALGWRIANELQVHGVDTTHIVWTDTGRIGIFFLEVGSAPRASTVLYDRRDSSMSQMSMDDFPWHIMDECGWLHLTGITAAISESCRALVTTALERAHQRGVPVSFDVNYRARLWSPETARAALEPMCRDADVLIVKQGDAQTVFGCAGTAEVVARALAERFARQIVVLTLGADGAVALDKRDGSLSRAPAHSVPQPVDRVGAGDAFAAGFIAGYLEGGTTRGLAMGNAVAAMKMSIPGDIALISRDEVESLIAEGAKTIRR